MHRMGVINHDVMTLSSGLALSNCYLSFTPGPLPFPNQPIPMRFFWTIDQHGVKTYQAMATLYIYTSREGKFNGLAAIEQRDVFIPAETASDLVTNVFNIFFANLKAQYTNTSDARA